MSNPRAHQGALLLDVLVGLAVFSMVVTGVITAMLFSQRGMLGSGDRVHGVFLNEQAIGALRMMRDSDFASLTEGRHGVVFESGAWTLSGTGVTADGYTTSVTISEIETGRLQVIAETTWQLGLDRLGSITTVGEITDWHAVHAIGNWASPSLQGSYVDSGTPLFNRAVAAGNTVFVTSETSGGGKGLYVFDISTIASPQRISSSFDLGTPGYDVAVSGDYLFVVTGDQNAEVRVYDVSDSTTLDSSDLVASIDVAGNSKARALAIFGNTLFVASNEDTSQNELFAYNITTPTSPTLLDSLNDSGASFDGMSLRDGYGYLASTSDTMELRVADVFNASDLTWATGNGYNLADTTDANAVATVGSYILVARDQGSVTEELHLFDVSQSPVPVSSPWNHEVGAHALHVDADPTATYAFAATENGSKELIVLDMSRFSGGLSPEVASYNTATGVGRGVYYSAEHDRVFLLTNKGFLILRPA